MQSVMDSSDSEADACSMCVPFVLLLVVGEEERGLVQNQIVANVLTFQAKTCVLKGKAIIVVRFQSQRPSRIKFGS